MYLSYYAAANESAPELAMKPNFLATSSMALDQASKLGLEANKNIISMFGNYQVTTIFSWKRD